MKSIYGLGEAILVTLGEKHFLCLLSQKLYLLSFCVCELQELVFSKHVLSNR